MSDYVFSEYDKALEHILNKGEWKSNQRTGIRTLCVCGLQTRYPLVDKFPIMTRRKFYPKSVFAELLWFISGSTNNNDLVKLGCNFWTPWVSEEFEKKHGFVQGSLGQVYGFQLRFFGGNYNFGKPGPEYGKGGFDQLEYMINLIKTDPTDRRILFSLWNPKALDKMRLPPCHYTYQVTINDNGYMTGHLTQRSNDYFVGVASNIQFYSALTCMIAQQTGYKVLEFVHEAVDAHIYENHIDSVKKYLETPIISSPNLIIKKAKDIFSYNMEDFILENYSCGIKIDAPVAV